AARGGAGKYLAAGAVGAAAGLAGGMLLGGLGDEAHDRHERDRHEHDGPHAGADFADPIDDFEYDETEY
ncbi:MAG TPA: hypothetical protein VJT31_20640, partial [Rugosimonospora sp.]|nr:hypothetical protein [Rugosimonospora sp.]